MPIFKTTDKYMVGMAKEQKAQLKLIDKYGLKEGQQYTNEKGEIRVVMRVNVPIGAEVWYSHIGRKIAPKDGGPGYFYTTAFATGNACKIIWATPEEISYNRRGQIKPDRQDLCTVKQFINWLDPKKVFNPTKKDPFYPFEKYKKQDPRYRAKLSKMQHGMVNRTMAGVKEEDILPELAPGKGMSDSAADRADQLGNGPKTKKKPTRNKKK